MKKPRRQYADVEKIIVITLVSCCVVFGALYMYFVSASVMHVVMRSEIEQDIALVHSQISQLESRYIDAQHRVSSDIATLQGYREVSSKIFIDREEPTLVLSSNGIQ